LTNREKVNEEIFLQKAKDFIKYAAVFFAIVPSFKFWGNGYLAIPPLCGFGPSGGILPQEVTLIFTGFLCFFLPLGVSTYYYFKQIAYVGQTIRRVATV
jgi:hypothetical protein